MLLLEGEALTNVYAEFKRVFDATGEGLSLLQFVKTFLENVAADIDKRSLVRLLGDLFEWVCSRLFLTQLWAGDLAFYWFSRRAFASITAEGSSIHAMS